MAWLILVGSAVLEAVWATALGYSDGLTNPVPSLVFLITTVLSMVGLAHAVRSIPLGTAYPVWTGLGAALTAAYAMVTGAESASVLKIFFLLVIIGCAAGLKALPSDAKRESD